MSQEELFSEEKNKKTVKIPPQKIICLGLTFASEDERREYFRKELRTKLPDLKKIEGFPIGEDEDIINLSDPPYYTACPNPWLNDFIAEWETEKENVKGRNPDFYVDEPYASDISEGKGHPIYNAHSYHTKVPHIAIMRYILHYTQPGDIIFDGFAGTGMTGVAANSCESPSEEIKYLINKEFKDLNGSEPNWGLRKSICGDLSPIANFIAYNYTSPNEKESFISEVEIIGKELDEKYGWMYETLHNSNSVERGKIKYVIWSDVFVCPLCSSEINFWENAVDKEAGQILDVFHCKTCNTELSKPKIEKAKETKFDSLLKKTITVTKVIPVLICYEYNKKVIEKTPDKFDLDLLKKIEEMNFDYWVPTDQLPLGYNTRQPIESHGVTNAHLFYSKRNLFELSFIFNKLTTKHKFVFTSILTRSSRQARFLAKNYFHGGGGWVGTSLSGTLFIPSFSMEVRPLFTLLNRLNIYKSITNNNYSIINTSSATEYLVNSNSVDYIFTDPPFGANIMYSELNFMHECWLKVKTNNKTEAIENKVQGKTLLDYQNLMSKCFEEYYRVLKSGKWMTVEFSNTSAAVWNGIQTALQRAGFIIANVAALDKKQGSFKAVTSPTAVKQDLVISCYKPSTEFENKFKVQQGAVALWDFVVEHLHHIPTHIKNETGTTAIIERSPKILFDRLITFYLMRGLPVPIDARDFQEGLKQRFIERNGMYFTAEQAAEYDEKKAKSPNFVQLSLIVTNESDAIEWLKERLRKQSQKYQDIMPDFRIATQSLRKGDTLPELQDILNESFIQEADGKWRTPDPNESKDREALRSKVLLKEFTGYVTAISQTKAKKLKEVRVEALRAGFKNSWEQKDFKTIVALGDMIPQNILLEDEQLLMYYDIAKDRV